MALKDRKRRQLVSRKGTLKVGRPLRRYGATVYATVDSEWAGKALTALEHAPEIQVVAFGKVTHGEDIGMRKITMRSLDFPRFWEGTEVDLFGDTEKGLLAIYHPAAGEE